MRHPPLFSAHNLQDVGDIRFHLDQRIKHVGENPMLSESGAIADLALGRIMGGDSFQECWFDVRHENSSDVNGILL